MKNIKRTLIIAGVVIVAIITTLIAIFYSRQKKVSIPTPLTIVSSIPGDNTTGASVFDPITITFNQPVDPLKISVTSTPPERWSVSQTTPSSITVSHQIYLEVSTTYKLTVSQHDETIGTLTFETAHDQNDPRLLQSLQSDLIKNYPLASFTPYETSSYRVVYSSPLTLEIDLKTAIDRETAISEVQSWVKSHGIDPLTHKYIVVGPVPSPQP